MKLSHPAKFFASLFDVLKDILTETNIEFGEYVVRIQAMDPQKATSVSLNLYGLSHYENMLGTINIGVYVPYLYRLIRNVDDNTIMNMWIEPEDPRILWISLQRNAEEEAYSTVMLHNIVIPVQDIKEFNNSDLAFSVDTKVLKKTIRELSHVSEEVNLSVIKKQVFLDVAGPMGTVKHELLDVKWLYDYGDRQQQDTLNKWIPVKYMDKFLNPRFNKIVDVWITANGLIRLIYSFDCGTLAISIAPIT